MTSGRVGVLGSGVVGEVLANGFLKHGYDVMRGSRDPKKLAAWQRQGGARATVGTFAEAAAFGALVVLAVKGTVAAEVIKSCAPHLKGKVVIDPTNPIAEVPPVHGVLQFFTKMNESLLEQLQDLVPAAHLVKAFSAVGSAHMVNPKFPGMQPTMFICGNEPQAKSTVTKVLTQFGWETEDMGPAVAARAIEPLCLLYCIRGFGQHQWNHAFKLLKT